MAAGGGTSDVKPPVNEIGNLRGDKDPYSWGALASGADAGIEKVLELQWPNSVGAYRSMMNDAQSYSLVQGLLLPIRAYRWYIDPNGAPPAAVERVSRNYNLPTDIDDSMFNRRRTARRFSFEQHQEDALRAVYYGHYMFEQVGEIGPLGHWDIQKLGARPPATITEINTDPDGGLRNIVQGYNYPTPLTIPVNRLVAYVWDREGANWVGRSMLRSIYRNYIVKDRVLRVGAINIERAGGIPYVNAPEGSTGDQIRDLDNLARRFRVGESAGAALPHGAQLKFAAAAGGDGAVAYIKQQNEEMSRAFFAMVNMLGTTNSGSRGLGDKFHEILQIAQFTIAKWFCDTFNEHVLEDDVVWNEGELTEYAPLLRFDAGRQDPMMGIDQMTQQDPNGMSLQVNSPVTRAAMGLDRDRHRRSFSFQNVDTSAARVAGQRNVAGGVAASSMASHGLMLPPRPLRRQPYTHEIQAQADFAGVESVFEMTMAQLGMEISMARSFQIDELRDRIVAANGDVSLLATLNTEVSASDRLRAHLQSAATISIDQAVQEASRQGVTVPRQPVSDILDVLTARAGAIDQLLQQDIAQSARREALRLTGGGLSPVEVADAVRAHLQSLSGANMKDLLGGAVQSSINSGRRLVFQKDGEDGTIFASELLDTNTCSNCVAVDGREYASIDDAERDYPTGHFKDCEGRERCRGMILKRYASGQLSMTSPAEEAVA